MQLRPCFLHDKQEGEIKIPKKLPLKMSVSRAIFPVSKNNRGTSHLSLVTWHIDVSGIIEKRESMFGRAGDT